MWYDFLSIAILAYTTIRGAMKGVVWQLAAIAGLVLCFVFAESISAAAGPYVKLEPPLNNWVVMIGAYLVFSFFSFGIARLLTEWLEKLHFGEYNRHLGAIFGLVKGVVICLVLTFFIVTVSESMREMLRHSRSGRVAAIIMDRLHPVMPEKLHESLTRYIDIHSLDSPDLDLRHSHDHSHASSSHGAQGDATDPAGDVLPPELTDLLSKLPPDVRDDFRDLLLRSWSETEPESREDLLQSLIRALRKVDRPEDVSLLLQAIDQPPERLLASVSQWLAAPENAAAQETNPDLPQPAPQPAPAPSRRQVLLEQISAEFSKFPLAQKRIQEDIEQQLNALPEAAALRVLEDWWADLVVARSGPEAFSIHDPDPSTNVGTTLLMRIERQLARMAPEGEGSGRLQ